MNLAKTPWADWMRKLQGRYGKCPGCKQERIHLYGIHTFGCNHCGKKEWYAERIGDEEQ